MKVERCLFCGSKKLTHVTERLDKMGIMRCEDCRLMMVESLSDDTEKLYTSEYFEKPKDNRSGYTNYLSSPVANLIGKYAFTNLLSKKPGEHLDLGCADGSLMEIFMSEGYESRGLEISKEAVNIANVKGLDVRFSKLEAFPSDLPKSAVVTAFDLLEHVANPRKVLEEIHSNLKENGYLVFSTLSVKKNDPTDYWFNHSLEHYVYYNTENLTHILSDIFGKDNFAFIEMEVNGIAEFWGFGKKGKLTHEPRVMKLIEAGSFDKAEPGDAFSLCLFYNQLSKFTDSEKIINKFSDEWSVDKAIQAKFYNQYYQGKFESAIQDSKENRHLVSTKSSAYWQALAYAEEGLARIKENDAIRVHNEEVIDLRSQIFRLRDELHTLRNSRVIGKVIKAREFTGERLIPGTKRLPRRLARKTKSTIGKTLPTPAKDAIRQTYRFSKRKTRNLSSEYRKNLIKIHEIVNKKWDEGRPLVSVVIPYYNQGETIGETIGSLLTQTFTNFEIIIVNDGSTDQASLDKLAELKEHGADFVLIDHKENIGKGSPAAARNSGIEKAKGKYIICLDSDDTLDPTYIEKSVFLLESQPDASLITTHQQMFGAVNELYKKSHYDPLHLIKDNSVITAAMFKKEAWQSTAGYKPGIGYEDWEFWLCLSENGYWGKLIPEPLFRYRVALQSRYVEDKDVHWNNIKTIRALHPKYKRIVKELLSKRRYTQNAVDPETAFINLSDPKSFDSHKNGKPNILITVSWMTFGGAETLIYNYCREVKEKFNITFITGLESENEWEYKFKEITPNVYHLTNLFAHNKTLWTEFISNYIQTRQIDILHVVHNGWIFELLPELKGRHPNLKVIVTMFNDRAEHFELSINHERLINTFSSDNEAVAKHYRKRLGPGKEIVVIPNGINCYDEFSPSLYSRDEERKALGIEKDDLAVFFVGRLSEEKNPDVFLEAARHIFSSDKNTKIKFFIVGDGPMRQEIEKTITSIGSKNIKNLGYQTEVAKYLSAADIFVLPSSIEGFPLSVLEAMAMNVVTIASDVGAVSEVVRTGKDGFVISPGSVREITEVISALQNDRELLEKMKSSARATVEKKYSNRILGINYRKLYEGLLS